MKKSMILLLFNQINENYENESVLELEQLKCKDISTNEYQNKCAKKIINYKKTFSLLRDDYLTDIELENLIFSYSPSLETPSLDTSSFVTDLIFEAYKECLNTCLEDKVNLLNDTDKIVEIYYYVSARSYCGNFTFTRFTFLMFLLSKITDKTTLKKIADADIGRIYSLVIAAMNDETSSFFYNEIILYIRAWDEYEEGNISFFDKCVSYIGTLLSLMKSPVLAALNLCDTATRGYMFNHDDYFFRDATNIPIYILRLLIIEKRMFTESDKKYLIKKLHINAQQNMNISLLRLLRDYFGKSEPPFRQSEPPV